MIDENELLKELRFGKKCESCERSAYECDRGAYYTIEELCGMIDDALDAVAHVDLVRCGECKYRGKPKKVCNAEYFPCQIGGDMHRAFWFCADGKRSEADEESGQDGDHDSV